MEIEVRNIAVRFGPRTRAVQRYLKVFHLVKGFDPSERGGVSILGHGVGLIDAEDIVGEAAQSGEDSRGAADTRSVFVEGDVAGIVLLVFNAPMFANGVGGLPGKDRTVGY
jgi:hypothetical protein